MSTSAPITVLYVGGTGRSGSTVLANLLGEVPGYVSVGELRFLWERGIVEDRLCGCGRHFGGCGFWAEVLDLAFGDEPPDPQLMHQMLYQRTRLRALPGVLLSRRRRRANKDKARQSDLVVDALDQLYRAIAEVAGAQVVVDSSKLPTYAALLDSLVGLEVRLLHLVRDPRAAAFSWLRKKDLPDRTTPGYMEQRSVTKSAVLWTVWNGALELMWRTRKDTYCRITYERLVLDPQAGLASLVSWMGTGGDPRGCFTGERSVRFGVHHTVAGNPARLDQGDVQLSLDDEWLAGLDSRSRRLVSWLTGPLLHRYGYLVTGL